MISSEEQVSLISISVLNKCLPSTENLYFDPTLQTKSTNQLAWGIMRLALVKTYLLGSSDFPSSPVWRKGFSFLLSCFNIRNTLKLISCGSPPFFQKKERNRNYVSTVWSALCKHALPRSACWSVTHMSPKMFPDHGDEFWWMKRQHIGLPWQTGGEAQVGQKAKLIRSRPSFCQNSFSVLASLHHGSRSLATDFAQNSSRWGLLAMNFQE